MKKKFYVYAGYYEVYVSAQPMPEPYILQSTHRKIERALEAAEKFDVTINYCESVKNDLPTFLYETLQDQEYEYAKF